LLGCGAPVRTIALLPGMISVKPQDQQSKTRVNVRDAFFLGGVRAPKWFNEISALMT
jgi:hypothetical protein